MNVENSTRLLPDLMHAEMADRFRLIDIAAVLPAGYDGTPNTPLEVMACGSFSVDMIPEQVDFENAMRAAADPLPEVIARRAEQAGMHRPDPVRRRHEGLSPTPHRGRTNCAGFPR